jgi:hypothetical protein
LQGIAPLLYRLPELLAADAAAMVFIPADERDADALRAVGLVGGGGMGRWCPTEAAPLRGRHIVIRIDSTPENYRRAEEAARSLAGIAARVGVLALPNPLASLGVADRLAVDGAALRLGALAADVAAYKMPRAISRIRPSPRSTSSSWISTARRMP